MNCPDCNGHDCIHIEIRLTHEMVQFYSCRKCEAKWWENEGGPVALEQVLGRPRGGLSCCCGRSAPEIPFRPATGAS
jgi:hypothetical protein